MNCTDIGIIQAFLDGELSHQQSSELSGHIAACDACALMLADAETESAMVFSTLEREIDTLVPTQRLWNKINDSIELERANLPWWKKIGAFASVVFANPSLSAAGTVLIFAIVGGAFWFGRTQPVVSREYVASSAPSTIKPTTPTSQPTDFETKTSVPTPYVATATSPADRRPVMMPAGYRAQNLSSQVRPLRAVAEPAMDSSGEDSYISTISSLSKSVRGQKDMMMKASERVAFERDLALVDDSIKKMRDEVKKNPKNDSARQVLYTSYQNKIDLLHSLAQKEELVASLK